MYSRSWMGEQTALNFTFKTIVTFHDIRVFASLVFCLTAKLFDFVISV